MQCSDCQTMEQDIANGLTKALNVSLSLADIERRARLKKRKIDVLKFLNRHIACGFMRNKPGWVVYK